VVLQNNFRAAVVFLNLVVHFDRSALQLANVADILPMAANDHHYEGAQAKILSKIQIVNTPLNAHNRAGEAFDLAHGIFCVVEPQVLGPRPSAEPKDSRE
jgi:hypothetical protein